MEEFYAPGIPAHVKDYGNSVKKKFEDNANTAHVRARTEAAEELPVLPPNISRERFNAAIAKLRDIVDGHVELVDKPLDDGWYLDRPLTHDAYPLDEEDWFVNSAIVQPGNVEEVQAVVRWANEFLIPIYAISMGRNFGYGGAAGRVRGSVLVDVGTRMNKVLEVDNENATCLLEPGVSYYMLYDAVKAAGGKLWIDVPDLGGGSVIGNSLDRGVGYTPYGDHFGMHCGMEIVLANGELIRTGMGALPDPKTSHGSANTWQLFPYGFGPYVDGLFTQSNFGIVTKMGFYLMPDPGGHQTFALTFAKEDDLHDVVEIMRPLRIANVIANTPHLRHVMQEASVYGDRKSFWSEDRPIPYDRIDDVIIPKFSFMGNFRWIMYICVYGPEAAREANMQTIKDAFLAIPGARFWLPEDTPANSYLRSRVKIYSGQPDLRELDWVLWLPNGSHTAFSPISPATGKDALRQFKVTKALHEKWGFDYFPTFCPGWREMHHIDMIIYDRGDPDSRRRARGMLGELIDEARKEGWGEYRTHLSMQDQVMGVYDYNNGSLLNFHNLIKNAVDPNGIMAPGKSGVWGNRWQKARKNDALDLEYKRVEGFRL